MTGTFRRCYCLARKARTVSLNADGLVAGHRCVAPGITMWRLFGMHLAAVSAISR